MSCTSRRMSATSIAPELSRCADSRCTVRLRTCKARHAGQLVNETRSGEVSSRAQAGQRRSAMGARHGREALSP
eukprot:2777949-Alexandrium_andersonii.AAC.1